MTDQDQGAADPTPPSNRLGGRTSASPPPHPKMLPQVAMSTLSLHVDAIIDMLQGKGRQRPIRSASPSGRQSGGLFWRSLNRFYFSPSNRQGALAHKAEISCTQKRHDQTNRLVNHKNHFRCDPHSKLPQGKWINATQLLAGHPKCCRKAGVGRLAYDTGVAIKDLASTLQGGWGIRVGVLCPLKAHI